MVTGRWLVIAGSRGGTGREEVRVKLALLPLRGAQPGTQRALQDARESVAPSDLAESSTFARTHGPAAA
jgi:hypothetical protein